MCLAQSPYGKGKWIQGIGNAAIAIEHADDVFIVPVAISLLSVHDHLHCTLDRRWFRIFGMEQSNESP